MIVAPKVPKQIFFLFKNVRVKKTINEASTNKGKQNPNMLWQNIRLRDVTCEKLTVGRELLLKKRQKKLYKVTNSSTHSRQEKWHRRSECFGIQKANRKFLRLKFIFQRPTSFSSLLFFSTVILLMYTYAIGILELFLFFLTRLKVHMYRRDDTRAKSSA